MQDSSTFNDTFLDLCEKQLGELLISYGFRQTEKFKDVYGANLTYCKNEQEVIIYSDTHPQDYPYFFNICFKLNDKTVDNPDYEKVPLWYIKNTLNSTTNSHEYNLADNRTMSFINADRLPWLIGEAKKDLENYHLGFLTDDTGEFIRLRQDRFNKKAYR